MTMHAYLLSAGDASLETWGTPEDIGCETVEGAVSLAGSFDLGSPDDAVFGGRFSASKGKYRVTYGFDEHATVLDGEVALTDEESGKTQVYGPGDAWIIKKGTKVLWDIRSEKVVKSYLAVVRAD
ncbi:cupin domain-containing protein [Roseibium sp. SCP14]|uniref:cupin domain-containing protein n=1 Tax=Roseibium sp. SCP14 TaxID=3141375 RepID=UPI0033395699